MTAFSDMEAPSNLLRRDVNGDLWFICPGCEKKHRVCVDRSQSVSWDYNGNPERPTFSPSVLVTWPGLTKRCHSFVTDGQIRFLDDCSHKLAGQTVPLPAWED